MRVAIIADVRGWALDHIAHGIQKHNPDPDLSIDIFYERELRAKRAEVDAIARYDVVYPFSLFQANFIRRRLPQAADRYITTVHMGPLGGNGRPGTTPPVDCYDHVLYEAAMRSRRLSVVSPQLQAIWQAARPETAYLHVGIEPAIFYPLSHEPQPRGDRPLRIGWVGNPGKPYKRFDLVEVACDAPGLELCLATWSSGWGKPQTTVPRTLEQMGDFYRAIDVLLCMSDHEGLPTPAVEAAACGVPIVSVDVGVIRELVGDNVTGFVVKQKAAAARDCLEWLRDHETQRCEMSRRIYERGKARYWPNVVGDWIEFIKGEEVQHDRCPLSSMAAADMAGR